MIAGVLKEWQGSAGNAAPGGAAFSAMRSRTGLSVKRLPWVAMFVVSYAVFLLLLEPESHSGQQVITTSRVSAGSAQKPVIALGFQTGEIEKPSPERVVNKEKPLQTSPEAEATTRPLEELRRLAISADEADDRLSAINQLGTIRSAEAVHALQLVINQATDMRERARAIQSLRKLSEWAQLRPAIEDVLKEAMGDQDVNISAFAREAYEYSSHAK